MPVIIAGDVIVGERLTVAASVGLVGAVSFAKPKSSTLTVPSRSQLDVRGLQIAMDDSLFVRGLERVGDLSRNWQCFLDREWPLRDPISQRRPFDEFEDQRVHGAGFFEAVDGADVGMIQGGEDLRFASEARKSLRIAGESVGAGS